MFNRLARLNSLEFACFHLLEFRLYSKIRKNSILLCSSIIVTIDQLTMKNQKNRERYPNSENLEGEEETELETAVGSRI